MKKDNHTESHASKGDASNSEKLKLTIRLLPAALTWEQFTSQLEKYTEVRLNGGVINEYYVQGFYPKSPYDLPSFSRAYLLFKDASLMKQFIEQVKDKPFVEEKTGNQMVPQLEKALYSKMPAPESKLLKPTNKSIEKDHIFKEFLACLEDGKPFDLLETSQKIRSSAREKKRNSASSKKDKKNASKGGRKLESQSKKKKTTENIKSETNAADKKPQENTMKKTSQQEPKQPLKLMKNEKKSDKKKPKKIDNTTGPNKLSKPDVHVNKSKSRKGSKKGSKNEKNDSKEKGPSQDQKPTVLLQQNNKKDTDVLAGESHPQN